MQSIIYLFFFFLRNKPKAEVYQVIIIHLLTGNYSSAFRISTK